MEEDPNLDNYDLTPIKNSGVPIIWVIGGPGSGKGTQCVKIVQEFGYTHLSTGDLLRHEVESGSDRGKNIDNIMKEGKLVPLDTVLNLLIEAMLSCADKTKGYLIDGFPREVVQGTKFEKRILPVNIVLYFEVSDATMMTRILQRAESSGRADDNEATIKKRIDTFHKNNDPILKKYSSKLKSINAEGKENVIYDEVKKVLKETQKKEPKGSASK